jgi:Bacterial PH domain
MAWLQASAAYTVTDRGVLVQSGPLRRWVDARLVERVRPTRTILSAPALSGNRLEISGRFGVVVVSPHDQAGFVRALRQTAPQMRLEGGLESLIAG